MEYTGTCIYCKQTRIVRAGDGLTQEEADKLATLECSCDEAQTLQKIEQKKTYAEANVSKLFAGDGAAAVEVMLHAVAPLACQKIKKLTLTTADGVKATLTAKENSIKVERVVTDRSALED